MNFDRVTRTFEIAEFCAKEYGDKAAFYQKRGQNWIPVSCAAYQKLSERLALGMITIGIQKGDNVATVFSNNTPQWNMLDIAFSQVGAVHIPVYPTISDSDYLYILNQAEVRYVFVGDQWAYNRVSRLQKELPKLEQIFPVDRILNTDNYDELLNLGENSSESIKADLDERKKNIHPNDITSIIYTSGTTGFPKGAMLTHNNLLSNTFAAAEIQPLGPGNRIFSFLPLCHVYERTANYQFQIKGTEIYYCENMKRMMANFREVRPHGTSVVPRVLEKIIKYISVSAKKKNLIIRWIIISSVNLGLNFDSERKQGYLYRWRYRLAFWAVFSKVRASLGGRINYIGCGGAPISPKIKRFFWACKMPVYEGYGLTECSPLVSLNFPGVGNHNIETVGPVISGVEVKLTDDKEILVKGPNCMSGYFKNPELTEETIVDNWLYTGDIGEIIDNKFLKITGRKKQMFKTSYGKYIVPQAIENKFADSPVIDHLMVIGEGKHCAGAVISPNFLYLRKIHSIGEKTSNAKLIELSTVKKSVFKEIEKVNKSLGRTEQIKKHLLVPDVWSSDTGELSLTMKLKRNIILKKYNKKIHLLYKEESI